MILCKSDYDTLYPKRNVEDYELRIRQGRQIAKSSKCLIYSRGKIDSYLLQILQECFLYSEYRGNIDSDLLSNFDFCLCIDYRLKWVSCDGILNTLGWLSEAKWTGACGMVSGQLLGRRKIFNYPRFECEDQGESFHWDVGDLPMKVAYWSNMLALYDLHAEEDEVWFNPSFIGLV